MMKQVKYSRIGRGRLRRGVTLIEILIVLAIIGLISGGVAIVAIPKFRDAQISTTKQSAIQLHQVSELWRMNHPGECPTAQRLKDEKELSAGSKPTDAWDVPFKIDCQDTETYVSSSGPDKKEGTPDDIRIPEAAKQ